ncbi:hypothetical protein [Lacinutrix sp. Hel_I_90]|uniref:hypothetical protein n=1 Tax=Lacinutrix sp. Hel_I_90 TaxID=1249999 RepID=UPI000B02822E|nr:hypothetical protein [Lacinutrix sp. Hel_I_90]
MKKRIEKNYYDVVYRTKSGSAMVAKRIEASNAEKAKAKVKKEMKSSSTFKVVVSAFKL